MTGLRGLTWDHPRGHDALLAPTQEWMQAHPEVQVTWDARSLGDFGDDSLEERARHYDLLVIDHPHIPDAHREGWLLPLDGTGHDRQIAELAAHSVGASHASYEFASHQYALAIDAAAQVSVSRPDLVGESAPESWPEVHELARRGRVLWPLKPVDAMASLVTFLGQQGHPIAAGLSREPLERALDEMRELAALVPAACLDESPIDTAERLSGSDEWWYSPLAFGYTNYSRVGFRGHLLRYRDIPRSEATGVGGSCLGGAGISVSTSTAHPEAAIDLAFWLADARTQGGSYFASGGQPANALAWEDTTCNAATLDFFRGTRATLEHASVRPQWPGWMDAQLTIGELVNRHLRGDLDARRAIDGILAVADRQRVSS